MDSSKDEILKQLPALGIRHYKDGRVERNKGTEIVSPSLDPHTCVQSKDVVINPNTNLSARFYLPKIEDQCEIKIPVVIYIHGGGFCIESAFSPMFHPYCSAIAATAQVVVVSVNYRLAPEHPIPGPHDDSWETVKWVISHSRENCSHEPWLTKYADFDRVYFAGDSAGANITHNLGIRVGLEGLNGAKLVGIVLIQPFFWGKDPIKGETIDLNRRAFMDNLWLFVCSDPSGLDNPIINPCLDSNFSSMGCDKVLICVAEKDILRERGWDYYEKLGKSEWKGSLEIMETKGENHIFHLFNPNSEAALHMLEKVCSFLT